MSPRELRGFAPEALTRLREQRGMSRGDLARAADISPRTLWAWESGKKTPQPDNLAKVASVLSAHMDTFVPIPEDQRTLADLRALAGMTQPQLARAAGIGTTALAYLERAETRLTDDKAGLLSDALGLSPYVVRAAYERARSRPPGTPA